MAAGIHAQLVPGAVVAHVERAGHVEAGREIELVARVAAGDADGGIRAGHDRAAGDVEAGGCVVNIEVVDERQAAGGERVGVAVGGEPIRGGAVWKRDRVVDHCRAREEHVVGRRRHRRAAPVRRGRPEAAARTCPSGVGGRHERGGGKGEGDDEGGDHESSVAGEHDSGVPEAVDGLMSGEVQLQISYREGARSVGIQHAESNHRRSLGETVW